MLGSLVLQTALVTNCPVSPSQIATTDFLDTARGVLLARYVASRCPELDGVLERAGILQWFADFTDQAAEVPDHLLAPQPADNRPYPGGA